MDSHIVQWNVKVSADDGDHLLTNQLTWVGARDATASENDIKTTFKHIVYSPELSKH